MIFSSLKTCTKCKITKSLDEFYVTPWKKNGFYSWCKDCVSEHNKAYYRANYDKAKAYQEAKKEQIAKRTKVWQENNRKKLAKNQAKWQKANREKLAEYQRAYRARKKAEALKALEG